MKKIVCLCLSFILAFSMLSIASTASTVLYGDVNSDGVVDMADYLLFKKFQAKKVTNKDINRVNADINCDGKITGPLDVLALIKHLMKEKEISNPVMYTMDALENCMSLYGRAVYEDGMVKLSQTASGFTFKANCKGNIQVVVETEEENKNGGKLCVTVDDNFENIATADVAAEGGIILFELDLQEGEHTFLIQKATEHGQNALFKISAISIEGKFCDEKPAEKPRKIEFYGDSLTAGYGNLTKNGTPGAGTWQYQNGCQTFATFTAQKLGADYAIAAASGHGVMYGYGQKVDTSLAHRQTPDKYWDYTLVGDKTPWSRTNYDADLIVINFGTNDNSTNNMFDKTGVKLDKDEYKAEVKKLVETMKTENPDVQILWVLGMAPIQSNDNLDKESIVVKAIKEVDEELDYVNFYMAPAHVSGGDGHPTVAEHKTHATNLTNKILELYPDMFE